MIDFVVDDRQDIRNRLVPGSPRVVRKVAEVLREASDKLLCLPGAENEVKVRVEVGVATAARMAVSPLPPRYTLRGDDSARHAAAAHK